MFAKSEAAMKRRFIEVVLSIFARRKRIAKPWVRKNSSAFFTIARGFAFSVAQDCASARAPD